MERAKTFDVLRSGGDGAPPPLGNIPNYIHGMSYKWINCFLWLTNLFDDVQHNSHVVQQSNEGAEVENDGHNLEGDTDEGMSWEA